MPWVLIFFLPLTHTVVVGKSYKFSALNVLILEIQSIVYYTWIYDKTAILHKHFNTSGSIFCNITKVRKVKVFFFLLAMSQLIGKTKMKINKHLQKCSFKVSVLGTHAYILCSSLENVTLALIIVIFP